MQQKIEDKCVHMRFSAQCAVTRLYSNDDPAINNEDKTVTGYRLDVKVNCLDCGEPFEFIGVPGGYTPMYPTTSFDMAELRCPIRPTSLPPIKNNDNNQN